MRHDVTFPLYVEVDEIYHLACPASPVFYQRDPVQTTKTSVWVRSTCSASPSGPKAKILLASTSEVYGDPEVHPQDENYWGNVNPIGIRSCYDEGKRCAETLFFDYRRQHDMPIKVARIFNTYGPRHASGRRPGGVQLHRVRVATASRSPSTATDMRLPPKAPSRRTCAGRSIAQLAAWRSLTLLNGGRLEFMLM